MKKLIFVFGLFILLVTALVSCKNPNTDSVEDEVVEVATKSSQEPGKEPEKPVEPEQPIVNPVEDLSVNYCYLGDMLFADSMDFNKWFLTNGTGTTCYVNFTGTTYEGIIFKVEKVGHVHNPNKSTMMFRYNETLKDVERYESNQKWFYVEYATKYKVWVSKEFINPANKDYWIDNTTLLDTSICKDDEGNNIYDSEVKVDGTWIKLTYSQNEDEDVYTFEYKDQDKAQYYN